jgi:hypothetical protein
MLGSAHGAMRLPPSLVGPDHCRRHRAPLCRVSALELLRLWTTSPGARALGTSLSSTIGLPMCLKSSYLKRGLLKGGTCGWGSAVFGRELLEIDMGMWFSYTLLWPHRHLVVHATVTSARTNTNVPHVGARLPLPGSLALGALCGFYADLRIFAMLGTPSVQFVHDYYLFALGDGGRLVPMAAELVYRLAILVTARRFLRRYMYTMKTLV